jgi:hypothetical protein
LTFPSGFLGELDLYFFVDVRADFGGGSWGGFLVGRRKDAEGDRDAGFKIQVGDSRRHKRELCLWFLGG